MKKVIAFGTFDKLHKGHEYYLKQAKKNGYLIVVIARDKNVKKIKGKNPRNKENKRLENVKELGIANEVHLGSKRSFYDPLKKFKPDIIFLGYDQKEVCLDKKKLKELGLSKVIIKRAKGYKTRVYKSSLIK